MMELMVLIVAIVISIYVFKLTKNAQTKKGTSKAITLFASLSTAFLSFVIIIVVASSTIFTNNKDTTQSLIVFSVSDYNYTMKDKQSVSIIFGKTNEQYYDLTVFRDSIKPGIELNKTKQNYIDALDASATFGKDNYVFINKDGYEPFISFKIKELNYELKKAKIDISLKLYNINNKEIKELKNCEIEIKDTMFDNLVKDLK